MLYSKIITFLFGSGISIPTGMPKTDDPTKQVISGEGIIRHIDGNYYFGQLRFADENPLRVLKFLGRVKLEIDEY